MKIELVVLDEQNSLELRVNDLTRWGQGISLNTFLKTENVTLEYFAPLAPANGWTISTLLHSEEGAG